MNQYSSRTSSMNEAADKFERGAGNLRSSAREAANAGQDAAESARRKASNFAAETAESVSDLAGEARDTATDMAHRGMDYAESYASRVEDATRRNPLGAVATALFAGLAIGYLSRGRR